MENDFTISLMIFNDWRSLKLTAHAGEDVLQAFEAYAWPVSYAEGETVLWEGDDCETIYFVISGMVEVYRTAKDGREHTLRVLRAGESFNLVPALMQNGKNLASVRCLAQTDLLVVEKKDMQSILDRYPKFAVRVLSELAERLAGMTGLAGDLALNTVRQRTASFLIREATNNSHLRGKPWTQDDMARQIGTVRDVIGRTLRDFEENGFIRRDRGKISLIDRDGLEQTANGDNTT